MATIKSYTDIEQSKKLAEILPLESADMYFRGHQSITNPKEWEHVDTPNVRFKYVTFDDKRIFFPCWSLAALLSVLPKGTNISTPKPINALGYCCWNQYDEIYADNPVDACVAMIEKLNELNLL